MARNHRTRINAFKTSLNFIDAEGQSYTADATTFDGIIGSDSASDLIEGILLPMHPVNLYDIFGLTVMEEGLTGEHEGWGWVNRFTRYSWWAGCDSDSDAPYQNR